MANLINNTSELQDILDLLDEKVTSSIILPTLSDEGTSEDVVVGKQLINSKGEVVVGSLKNRTSLYGTTWSVTPTELLLAGEGTAWDKALKVRCNGVEYDTIAVSLTSIGGGADVRKIYSLTIGNKNTAEHETLAVYDSLNGFSWTTAHQEVGNFVLLEDKLAAEQWALLRKATNFSP